MKIKELFGVLLTLKRIIQEDRKEVVCNAR